MSTMLMNLVPSIKFPDGTVTYGNAIISMLFAIVLVYTSAMIQHPKWCRVTIITSIIGSISCLYTFIISIFDMTASSSVIYDILSGLHYLLYVIFVTPFFGANVFFRLGYGSFSALVMTIYVFIFIILKGNTNKQKDYSYNNHK